MTENPSHSAPVDRTERSPSFGVMPAPPPGGRFRVFLFFSCALLLTGFVSLLFADLLWRTGWSASRTVLMVLFVILFLLAAIGCMTGVFGFLLRAIGDKNRITGLV